MLETTKAKAEIKVVTKVEAILKTKIKVRKQSKSWKIRVEKLLLLVKAPKGTKTSLLFAKLTSKKRFYW